MAEVEKVSNFGIGRGSGPIASTSQLGKILSLTGSRISQLTQEGILKKLERGKYPLCDSVHNYVKYLQNSPKNQWGSKGEEETDFERERLRRTKEEADKLEIFNARSRGELVEVAKVKVMGEKVMAAMKTRILNMPMTEEQKDQCLRDLHSLRTVDFSDES